MASIKKLQKTARRHEQNEEWRDALETYIKILRETEERGQDAELSIYNRLGDIRLRLGNAGDAVNSYKAAADRYAEAGLVNNAIALCRKALRHAPEDSELLLQLGRLSARQGFMTDSRRWFLQHAEIESRAGRNGAAVAALTEFADASGDADVREMLARELVAEGRTDEAAKQLRLAHAAYSEAGASEKAESALARLNELSPEAAGAAAAGTSGADADTPPGIGEAPGDVPLDPTIQHAPDATAADAPDRQETHRQEAGLELESVAETFDAGGDVVNTPESKSAADAGSKDVDPLPLLDLGEPETPGAAESDGPAMESPEGIQPLEGLETSGDVSEGSGGPGQNPADTEDFDLIDLPADLTTDLDDPAPAPESGANAEPEPAALPEPGADAEQDAGVSPESGADAEEEPDALPELGSGPDAEAGLESGFIDLPADLTMDLNERAAEPESEPAKQDEREPEPEEAPAPAESGEGGDFNGLSELSFSDEAAPELEMANEDGDEGTAFTGLPDGGAAPAESAGLPKSEELTEWIEEVIAAHGSNGAVDHLRLTHPRLAEKNRIDDALVVIDAMIELAPDRLEPHQTRLGYVARLGDRGRLVDAHIALAEAMTRTGMGSKARAVYRNVLELDPKNERVLRALGRTQAAPAATSSAPPPGPQDFVDLSSLVEDNEPKAGSATTRFTSSGPVVTGDEERDFSTMLAEFRTNVARYVGEDDPSSHYDLGLAFKDMGLIDEAITEFQTALRGRKHELKIYEELGGCFMAKQQYAIAVGVLNRALRVPVENDTDIRAILYDLGRCHEALEHPGEARAAYEQVAGLDMGFRDVAKRMARL